MNRKWLIFLAFGAVLIAVLIAAYFLFRKSESPPPPPPPASSEIPPYQPPYLGEEEAILLTGKIVVRSIGTFDNQDFTFRSLRSIQSYVTEELWGKLQKKIDRGVAPNQEPFERRTKVVAEKFVNKTDDSATVAYTVEVWQSNGARTSTEVVTVELEKILGQWYADGSSQIQQ